MPFFAYRARDTNGALVTGQLEAGAVETIRDFLSDQGLIPISINKVSNLFLKNLSLEGIKTIITNLLNKVKQEELMLFTLQFHTLFKSGMNIETILHTLAGQAGNKYFSEIIMRIKNDVASGSSLSQSFAKHPQIFNDLYINMLATGEEAGILENVLEKMATLIKKEHKLKSSVKGAMLYPKIVMVVFFIASFILLRFVIPKFADFYSQFGAELPGPTKLLINSSAFFRKWIILIVTVMMGAYFVFKKWKSTPKGRYLWDRLRLRVPVFGQLDTKVANARFAHIMGALYAAGIPVIKALSISAKTIGNEAFTRDVLTVQTEVEKGKGISESMRMAHHFNPLLIEATAIGEKSGSLDDMYAAIGSHYDSEVDIMLENMNKLIEPFLLFFIMGFVALFAAATLLPIWNMANVIHA